METKYHLDKLFLGGYYYRVWPESKEQSTVKKNRLIKKNQLIKKNT